MLEHCHMRSWMLSRAIWASGTCSRDENIRPELERSETPRAERGLVPYNAPSLFPRSLLESGDVSLSPNIPSNPSLAPDPQESTPVFIPGPPPPVDKLSGSNTHLNSNPPNQSWPVTASRSYCPADIAATDNFLSENCLHAEAMRPDPDVMDRLPYHAPLALGWSLNYQHSPFKEAPGAPSNPPDPLNTECYIGCFSYLSYGSIGKVEYPLDPAFINKRNERERQRVRCVNDGYTRLRDHLPQEFEEKRLSKVETLRAAISYIKHLQKILEAPSSGRPLGPSLGKDRGF
ncbi:hypothetical protein DNTS_006121 [Danionella cerebrum]|uniref:BHLH domain-containing protein n=1 Tax=Danionella cerebrum TaxID=2873325 RepID=A0A553NRA8_9TELE|nr:hypothetical protein DNTS_006121 [Danionella translucida]